MYRENESKIRLNAPTPDYNPKDFALEIFSQRYALNEQESWTEACERVSDAVAVVESDTQVREVVSANFKEVLIKNLFMPGGRIWHSAGRPKGNLLNCYVVPCDDSREGWAKSFSDTMITTGMGGGVGLNFSPIRPRGEKINGTGGQSGGPCGLMHIINASGDVIRASGGRRPALMMCLDVDHPDIIEFLDKKLDLSQLNNANVSVVIPPNRQDEFIKCIKEDLPWQLQWNGKAYGTISARELWHKLVTNALKSAEPGILNFDLANKMSNIHYYRPLISTNPCGEIALEAYGACDLGALVLPRFVNDEGQVDWQLLSHVVSVAVRFLDNVIDASEYPVEESKIEMRAVRRVGLGILGLHHMLLLLGYKYSSPEGLAFVDKLFNIIRNAAYAASIDLAIEKGTFPQYDARMLNSGYMKTVSDAIYARVLKYGIRNCALLTIAPTGTTSIVCDVSSGIEPIYAMAYERRYRSGEEMKVEIIQDRMFTKFMNENRDMSILESTTDLPVRAHFEMQKVCQKYIDNAVSKTINIPRAHNFDEISNLMLEFLPHVKGVTVYVDGSRGESPLSKPMTVDEVLKSYCPRGVCAIA